MTLISDNPNTKIHQNSITSTFISTIISPTLTNFTNFKYLCPCITFIYIIYKWIH
jgi:hypothetical protein